MAADVKGIDPKTQELTEIIRAIQERVRTQHPQGAAAGIALADLVPLLHARDAAEAKVASIGKVNPRPRGLVNNLVQSVKRLVARALDWHVREQVEFNRAVMDCVEALLTALNESNRALAALAARSEQQREAFLQQLQEQRDAMHRELQAQHGTLQGALAEARELKDIRVHWSAWREEWDKKISRLEVHLLKGVADLQGAFQYRTGLLETNFREITGRQHRDFEGALERAALEIQQKIWKDIEAVRLEFERLIYDEVKTLRQRAQALYGTAPALHVAAGVFAAPGADGSFDALRFANRFRGSPEYVRGTQEFYLPYFQGHKNVLDIGCGRGEFLELMRSNGVAARGIDLSLESVELCRTRGLEAEQVDLFEYLARVPAASLDGIFSAQVIEHLPPEKLPEMIRLCAEALSRNGVLALETPNPECLAIFATHFYLDPTHTRPVPPPLLFFYLEEAGFGGIELHRHSPAVDSSPSLQSLPDDFRDAFFGGLDYAAIGRKL